MWVHDGKDHVIPAEFCSTSSHPLSVLLFLPHILQCSVTLREGTIDLTFKMQQSSITHSQYFANYICISYQPLHREAALSIRINMYTYNTVWVHVYLAKHQQLTYGL